MLFSGLGHFQSSAILYIISYALLLGNKKGTAVLRIFIVRNGSPASFQIISCLLQTGSIGCDRAFLPDLLQIADSEFLKTVDLCEILSPHLLIGHH